MVLWFGSWIGFVGFWRRCRIFRGFCWFVFGVVRFGMIRGFGRVWRFIFRGMGCGSSMVSVLSVVLRFSRKWMDCGFRWRFFVGSGRLGLGRVLSKGGRCWV